MASFDISTPAGAKIIKEAHTKIFVFLNKLTELGVVFDPKYTFDKIFSGSLHYNTIPVCGLHGLRLQKTIEIELRQYSGVITHNDNTGELNGKKVSFSIYYCITGFSEKFSRVLQHKFKKLMPELQDNEFGSPDATRIEPKHDEIKVDTPHTVVSVIEEIIKLDEHIKAVLKSIEKI